MGSRGEASRPAAATVQELAGALDARDDVPAQYVARRRDDQQQPPTGAAVSPLPAIDLGRLRGQGGAAAADDEAAKLRLALRSWGLFLVTNHGVDAAVMDGMMASSREFFRQPAEEKRRYSNLVGGERFQVQGYGADTASSSDQTLDWSGRLYLKVEPEDERNLELWPARPERFR